MFKDRVDAGQQLARALDRFRADNPLILALPRGGVVLGAEIARELGCELEVLLVKKLRAPGNPELALGAVAEDGRHFLSDEVMRLTGASDVYVKSEISERLSEITDLQRTYREVKPGISPTGRVAILVDDGLATGSTMIAAVQATAMSNPQKIVAAVPVSSVEALAALEQMREVGEVVCLSTPPWFGGVGQFYRNFTQVSDDEVIAMLREFA